MLLSSRGELEREVELKGVGEVSEGVMEEILLSLRELVLVVVVGVERVDGLLLWG